MCWKVLAVLYERTRSLIYPMISHAILNGYAMLAIYMAVGIKH